MTHLPLPRVLAISFAFMVIFLMTVTSFTGAVETPQPGNTPTAILLGRLEHPDLTESSGIAASRIQPNIFWTHNDSSGEPRIFAFTKKGKHVATVNIEGAAARDWEDICSFTWRDEHWLMIGDTGNNWVNRHTFVLYIIKEPALDISNPDRILNVPMTRKLVFEYRDVPRDCEAVAVDVATEEVLLITKRIFPVVLYTLPLQPESDEILVAQPRTQLGQPLKGGPRNTRRTPIIAAHHLQPTALDLSPDGRTALVVTYKNAYLFSRKPGQSWEQGFSSKPIVLNLPTRRQGESGCFTVDGRRIVVGSEGEASPIWLVTPPTSPDSVK